MSLSVPVKVVYFAAVMYNPLKMSDPREVISRLFGTPVLCSDEFDFSHTEYYTREMGQGLRKYFAAFKSAGNIGDLPDFKLLAIDEEKRLAIEGNRVINIDPGYLAQEKVVAASTKNFTHRIYIGKGIYGDLQLMRKKGSYTPMPWTYPDYVRPEAADFFNRLYRVLGISHS